MTVATASFLLSSHSISHKTFKHMYYQDVETHTRFESIAVYNKGFVVGGSKGFFAVYEKTEDKKDPFLLISHFNASEHDSIAYMSVSPSSETIACYTRNKQILLFDMLNMDNSKNGMDRFKQLRPFGNHQRGVVGLDLCLNRPVAVTCSLDKTLRVFNYLTKQCEIEHKLKEEPTAVAVHPMGNMVVVGLKDRVKTFHLLMDSLEFVRDLQLKHCTVGLQQRMNDAWS